MGGQWQRNSCKCVRVGGGELIIEVMDRRLQRREGGEDEGAVEVCSHCHISGSFCTSWSEIPTTTELHRVSAFERHLLLHSNDLFHTFICVSI